MSESHTGAVLLDKAEGISSFKALSPVKRAYRGKKVGHTGTLDPFASGLLVVLVGPLTRLAGELTGLEKHYSTTVTFGEETDTLDPTGTVVHRCDTIPDLSEIESVLPRFIGTITQVPPIYSAVHINGRRAYDLARRGIDEAVPERTVTVSSLSVTDWSPPELSLEITCGSGTYVRSLARDIGLACGSRAHVSRLRRTRVGQFHIGDSQSVDDFSARPRLVSAFEVLRRMPGIDCRTVHEHAAADIAHGKPFRTAMLAEAGTETSESDLALFDTSGNFRALVQKTQIGYKYRFVVPP